MLYPRISGVASYVPDDILDNEMLLICATSNPDYRFPSTGSVIAYQCKLSNAYAYDIQGACAGFLVALQDAAAYIRSGMYKKIVVVAAEKMSSMTNYHDRTTCPLFGDAAGCMLIEPSEERVGIIVGVFHINGEGLPHLLMKAGGSVKPATHETVDAGEHYIYQEGRAVYKHAVTDMEAVADRAKIDPAKVLVNIEHYGNTSAASIPLCIDEYKGRLKKGDKMILTAFGAGFTWGALYIIWDL